MANRHKLRTTDFQPVRQTTAYIQPPRTKAEAIRSKRTVVCNHNPYHEGLNEARASGSNLSRRVAIGLAKNGVPHHNDVATDHRIRAKETDRIRREARFTRLHRKIQCDLQAFEYREAKKD